MQMQQMMYVMHQQQMLGTQGMEHKGAFQAAKTESQASEGQDGTNASATAQSNQANGQKVNQMTQPKTQSQPVNDLKSQEPISTDSQLPAQHKSPETQPMEEEE